MTGLIPLLCALALIQASAAMPGSTASTPVLIAWLVGGTAGWMVCTSLLAGFLAKAGSARWLERWELVAELLILGWLAWLCLGLGWGRGWRAVTPLLAPWALWQLWLWWSLAPAVNRICGTTYTPAGHLLHHARFALLPAILFLPLMDAVAAIGNHLHLASGRTVGDWFLSRLGQAGNVLASIVVGLIALTGGPWLLVRLWGTRPLPKGPQLDRLRSACHEAGIGINQVRSWHGAGGAEYNAMVLGLIPAGRYVLFSDDLLARLPADQLRAVLGHELSHARRRHLLLYLLFLACVGMVAWWAQQAFPPRWSHLPFLDQAITGPGLAVLVVLAAWQLGFGPLSRACERQADVDGAAFATPRLMGDALLAVARLSGTDPRQPSWHHGSMASRVAFLDRLAEEPALAARQHRLVRTIAAGLIVVAVVLGWGLFGAR